MSWLFSRALVAVSSGDISSDGVLYAPSSATPTPQVFSLRVKTTDVCLHFPSGMTCGRLTDDRGEAVLTWCLAASPVRTSPPQARAQASKEAAPVCGPRWRGSSVKWDHDSSSWKTVPSSPDGVSMSFSGTWPRWGVMRDGVCSERLTPVRPTNESASGSWPTPNKMDAADTASMCDPKHWHVRAMQKMEQGIHLQFPLRVAVQMWPAPEAGMPVATPHSQMLRETWPTPRKCAAMNASMTTTLAQRNHGNLEEAVAARMIPDGGKLNPPWVEWLMGWPLGWTDLRASAMDRFQQWRRSHGVA